ncbi:MAG: ADP-ribosylglycohydrolase family protein [Patescibacteria group bacterium]|nr:MAG: ADP-ribosylglycohydrolase family protein [Patescibacteria group bacterium]
MRMKMIAVNSMLGVHLGDALGVPTECQSREAILAATDGRGVTGPMFDLAIERKVLDTRGLPPGATSDDSQLANAVADALIQAGDYEHELMVLHHLHALWHDVAGWGGTTKRSLYEIDKWYRAASRSVIRSPNFGGRMTDAERWAKAEPRHPNHPARRASMSRGNGVAMKIAPLALFLAARHEGNAFNSGRAFDLVYKLGRMTHEDPISSIAAYAIASVVSDRAVGISAEYASLNVRTRVEAVERTLQLAHHGEDRFSQALTEAFRLAVEPEALWAFGSAGNSDALHSVALALGIWYRHCEDREPTAAVLEAINAGGDTDTVASMVGAMMGAGSDDPDWWPKDWVSALKDGGSLARTLGADLWRVANGGTPDGWDRGEMLRKIGYK